MLGRQSLYQLSHSLRHSERSLKMSHMCPYYVTQQFPCPGYSGHLCALLEALLLPVIWRNTVQLPDVFPGSSRGYQIILRILQNSFDQWIPPQVYSMISFLHPSFNQFLLNLLHQTFFSHTGGSKSV